MKKSFKVITLCFCSSISAYAGIENATSPKILVQNDSKNYALRCYGLPIRQGDVKDMYTHMSLVKIGENNSDRGRLIHDFSNLYTADDTVNIVAAYEDFANRYNISWAVCEVYPVAHVSCVDKNGQDITIDVTDKTSANAYIDGQVGGPDPQIFSVPAQDYPDYPQQIRYDSPVAKIEIGITPMDGVFYNMIPEYNQKSPYASFNEDGTSSYSYQNIAKDYSCSSLGYEDSWNPQPVNVDASKLNIYFRYADDYSPGTNFHNQSHLIINDY